MRSVLVFDLVMQHLRSQVKVSRWPVHGPGFLIDVYLRKPCIVSHDLGERRAIELSAEIDFSGDTIVEGDMEYPISNVTDSNYHWHGPNHFHLPSSQRFDSSWWIQATRCLPCCL
jgi:hypothetical protein